MSELGGLLLLLLGLGALTGTGGLAACCLRVRSPIEFLLATYVVAWTWLVGVALALSPFDSVTRGWLLAGLALGLAGGVAAWLALGRPPPPSPGLALAQAWATLRHPAIFVLAVAVALGALYVGALALFTPANDWDALAYHLARADLWRQEQGLGFVDAAQDWRINLNPPNAEIGQLATMALAGGDRYAALPQFLAWAALALAVAGLARRIGLGTREAAFGALAFATLPVVAVQASGALNDLVVASFLAAAAYFALGTGIGSLALFALAVGLALGTKFTALVGLPAIALVALVGKPPRRWPALLLAGLAGVALGSAWYLVNAAETGRLDGDAPDISGQRAEHTPSAVTTTALRFALSFVDMSGAPFPTSLLFLVPAGALAVVAAWTYRGSRVRAISLAGAAALTAAVVAMPALWDVGRRAVYRAGLLLDRRDLLEVFGWGLNTKAEPTLSWYGPLATLLLAVGTVAAVLAWRRGRLPAVALALAAGPWLLVLSLAVGVIWDPWRGRFVLVGVALAAATWGVLLRWNAVALAGAAIGSTALFLALANYDGKPSGLFEERSIWGTARWDAQTRLSGSSQVLRFVEESVPDDSRLGLALVGDHQIHPYFGPRLSRRVTLLPAAGGSAPEDADWLVLAPETRVARCSGAWSRDFEHQGWHVERRLGPDACLG
jgi:hypothetical protein